MFLCLLSADGSPVDDRERRLYMRRMMTLAGSDLVSVETGAFFAITAQAMVPLRPLVIRNGSLIAIGNVRLDNRKEVGSWAAGSDPLASDLMLVLQAYRERGTRCIPAILGDFAFVIYDQRIQTLIAARDAFGIKTLFMGERPRVLVLSSLLEPVHDKDDLDEEFVADFLLAGDPGPTRTIWADSQSLPQGSILTAKHGRVATERFWSPYSFEPAERGDERENAEHFLALFREAVRVRLEPTGDTWAELSGGLDSSAVVSMAQTLFEQGAAPQGIAGTITVVDELGSGDERRFSNAVLQRYELRNEIIWNPWPWQDGGRKPPLLDEPRAHYPYFFRDERECDLVRKQGASVLLSGMGSDHYLYGNKLFFSDWAANGQPKRAIRELVRWSIAEKQSVWKGLWRLLALPLAPAATNRWVAAPYDRVPQWIDSRFGRRTGIHKRLALSRTLAAKRGRRFVREVANELQELTRWLQRGPFEDRLELRYPFLHRPLVEFGLRLPVEMRAQPLAPKWVLRQALSGILPEEIRMRQGKGGIDSRILWALSRERGRLNEILRRPCLAELGHIRPDHLRGAVEAAWNGRAPNLVMLLAVLSLETWFFVRSGRWAVRNSQSQAQTSAHPGREVPVLAREGGEI